MKKTYFLIFSLVFITGTFFSGKSNGESLGEVIPKEFKSRKGAAETWNGIKNEWLKEAYPTCVKKEKLKLSCSECESVYLRSKFEIDASGKLIDHKITNGKMCGKPFNESLKKCFLDYFENYSFPPVLRDLKFEAQLGSGLSC